MDIQQDKFQTLRIITQVLKGFEDRHPDHRVMEITRYETLAQTDSGSHLTAEGFDIKIELK